MARESSRVLAACIGSAQTVKLKVIDGDDEIVVPIKAIRLLVQILVQMSEGRGVTVVAINAELSPQQAAEILNVSRSYFISLLEKGEIPFRKAGKRRRVNFEDVLKFQSISRKKQAAALEELTKLSQKLGLGY